MFGKDILLHFTATGFYAIPLNETNLNLNRSSLEDSNFVKVLLTIDNIEEKSKKGKKCIASKLHKKFGHPKSARLIDLIKTAGISGKDLLDMFKDLDRKQKEVIIDKISKHWAAMFGTPNLFLSNNGGEFNNELFRAMGEQLNINIKTTAAESLWSNNIVEKLNQVIGNMMEKVMLDV